MNIRNQNNKKINHHKNVMVNFLYENYKTQIFLKNITDYVIDKFIEYFENLNINNFEKIITNIKSEKFNDVGRIHLFSFQIPYSFLKYVNVSLTYVDKNEKSEGDYSYKKKLINIFLRIKDLEELLFLRKNNSDLKWYFNDNLSNTISHEIYHAIEDVKSNGKYNYDNSKNIDYLHRKHEIMARFAAAINSIPFVINDKFIDFHKGIKYLKYFMHNFDELSNDWKKVLYRKFGTIWISEKEKFTKNKKIELNVLNENT
jgi:hypothetical protein